MERRERVGAGLIAAGVLVLAAAAGRGPAWVVAGGLLLGGGFAVIVHP